VTGAAAVAAAIRAANGPGYVAIGSRGAAGTATLRRSRADHRSPASQQLVERSKGKIRADVAHEKITAMGYAESERAPVGHAP